MVINQLMLKIEREKFTFFEHNNNKHDIFLAILFCLISHSNTRSPTRAILAQPSNQTIHPSNESVIRLIPWKCNSLTPLWPVLSVYMFIVAIPL